MTATVALGVALRLTRTADGGRSTPLAGGCGPDVRFAYRPGWRLPGTPDPTGAPVLGVSTTGVQPGDEVRVVVVPPFEEHVSAWAGLTVGAHLQLVEGPRVCGTGRVLWTAPTTWPVPDADATRFEAWLVDGSRQLEFWPEHGAGPLWDVAGRPVDPADLGLSPALADRLTTFIAGYDEARLPLDGPGDPGWLAEGAAVLAAARAELAGRAEVVVTEPWWGEPVDG